MIYIQPPCKRTVIIGEDRYFLPFPYIVMSSYSISDGTSKLQIAFVNEEPKDNTLLSYVPFNNFITDFRVCVGNKYISEKETIDRFWFMGFKNTYVECFRCPKELILVDGEYNDYNILDYKKWSKLSIDDVLKINWIKSRYDFDRFKKTFHA